MSNISKITYTAIVRPTIRYIARVSNFAITQSLLIKLHIEEISMAFVSKLKKEMFSNLGVGNVNITSAGKVNVELIETVHVDNINMIFVPKSLQELFTTVSTSIGINSLPKMKIKNSLALGLGNISFSITGTVAELLHLSLYDPQTLGTLDLLTLDEMDRT